MTEWLKFTKMSGSGNTFIIVDRVYANIPENIEAIAKHLCSTENFEGSDGLLLMLKSEVADLKMVYINRDGSKAELCGNGLRCLAYFASKRQYQNPITFETASGILKTHVLEKTVRVQMPEPSLIKTRQIIEVDNLRFDYDFINLGVPHCIIETDNIDNLDVNELGRKIRFRNDLFPEGTNVDLVQVVKPSLLQIRTYERGVEKETLACGTGVVASSLVFFLKGRVTPPVESLVRSGETLTTYFKYDSKILYDIFLEGEVEVISQGEIEAWF